MCIVILFNLLNIGFIIYNTVGVFLDGSILLCNPMSALSALDLDRHPEFRWKLDLIRILDIITIVIILAMTSCFLLSAYM